ncbi:MAG: hypothetical protein KJ550_08830 [Proteobacteria bacterium]|nr:hypothetical protein [Desulfobacteraceae bacterium]MBU3981265.1 hypothetical protein [Pseudomonadota bacterium]MBU4013557.1 hypothetical protein [Pseudomonadota bacterium]MBU4067311.1 hypothetical protein [Pseudomonadota bacterium]MBU4103442.1 hypothetical protein [Patescibacteria group bacterium]
MISHLVTFILGAFTGAAGKYLADKYTDKRREIDKDTKTRETFIKIAEQMPAFIKEMQDDFLNSEYKVLREFFILPNNRVMFNSGGERCLFYYEDKHEDLMHKIKLLENNGFVYDVTHTNTPKYRIAEEFRVCVVKAKIKKDKVKL